MVLSIIVYALKFCIKKHNKEKVKRGNTNAYLIVKVKITLRQAVYRQLIRLETHELSYFFN
jgi:hypothetical protein